MKTKQVRLGLLVLFSYVLTGLLVIALLGGFGSGMNFGFGGLGTFSFNPTDESILLKKLEIR